MDGPIRGFHFSNPIKQHNDVFVCAGIVLANDS